MAASTPLARAVATYGRVNPNLGSFPDFTTTTNTRYNSLQVAANRRLSHNVQAQVSYTWGKCTDDGSFVGSFNNNANAAWGNPYNQTYDKSVCNYDITQSFRINGLWTLPFYKNRSVSGWQLSGIVSSTSGLPFTVFEGVDTLGFGTSVDKSPAELHRRQRNHGNAGGLWFRSDRLHSRSARHVRQLRTPEPARSWLQRYRYRGHQGHEDPREMNLQFRAEFFNLFNHTNYGVPIMGNGTANLYTAFVGGNAIPNANAGKILYDVGNPRQIQFALKLTF